MMLVIGVLCVLARYAVPMSTTTDVDARELSYNQIDVMFHHGLS